MAIIDRPDYPIGELIDLMERVKALPPEEQKAEMAKFDAGHPRPQRRLYLGRVEDDSVGIRLLDPQGRERIIIQVAGDGSPVIKFLDAEGKVGRPASGEAVRTDGPAAPSCDMIPSTTAGVREAAAAIRGSTEDRGGA